MEVVIAPDFLRNSAPKIDAHSTVNYVNLQAYSIKHHYPGLRGAQNPGGFFVKDLLLCLSIIMHGIWIFISTTFNSH